MSNPQGAPKCAALKVYPTLPPHHSHNRGRVSGGYETERRNSSLAPHIIALQAPRLAVPPPGTHTAGLNDGLSSDPIIWITVASSPRLTPQRYAAKANPQGSRTERRSSSIPTPPLCLSK
ncbi:hypothetical protein SKAU_G00014170 [Synaphobranchus kaupii]|uniref:Uncharacterized protein n=1 Tax=Synaphobranchus kaupii TaxID=118154 RepID=A0A9Q1JDS9_SYNKA|nr:hypothetical protein SKAU_G00014170 [Synaphobranchus kaupii]